MIRVGIVGLGYWGPNLVRCFNETDGAVVSYVCDLDENRLASVERRFTHVRTTKDAQELFDSGMVDAVVIATPTRTHLQLAEQSLTRGFHTFVEKPLAHSTIECQRLIELSNRHDALLFVGHVFLHATPVHKLRELVLKGELGELYYIKCNRLNLGPVRNDVNALWDLAPHDISIMLYLLGQLPSSVSCSGLAYLNEDIQDVCNLTLHFPGNRVGIIHVSWLDPPRSVSLLLLATRKWPSTTTWPWKKSRSSTRELMRQSTRTLLASFSLPIDTVTHTARVLKIANRSRQNAKNLFVAFVTTMFQRPMGKMAWTSYACWRRRNSPCVNTAEQSCCRTPKVVCLFRNFKATSWTTRRSWPRWSGAGRR